MIVTLCGSRRFDFERANRELSLRGLIVIGLGTGQNRDAITPVQKEELDLLHFSKIARSEAVFVLGDGYMGESTAKEIIFAHIMDKPVIHEKSAWAGQFGQSTTTVATEQWAVAEQKIRQGRNDPQLVVQARAVLERLAGEKVA